MENTEKIYWTEPVQVDKKEWKVSKMNGEKVMRISTFKSKQDAERFLKIIAVYIDCVVCYSGI